MDIATRRQLVRYALVGVMSNLLLFFCYLGLTALGLGPKLAMTFLYGIGVAQTFLFNRNWSFKHRGGVAGALGRYVAAYVAGYVLNLVVLWGAVDVLNFNHRWVQAVMIIVLAVVLFLLQKHWVFRTPTLQAASGA